MIIIKNIDSTHLNEKAFFKVMRKYAKSLKIKRDIIITFDKRIKEFFGDHRYDRVKKNHLIRIAVATDVDTEALKWRYISTGLHELKHAQQIEVNGYQKHNHKVGSIKDKHASVWFSRSETQARSYEDKHIHNAIDLYDSFC